MQVHYKVFYSKQIDTDGDGSITLEEWVKYASKHILEKERTLPPNPLSTDKNVTKIEFIK